jgi:hypothetical protein
MIVTIVITELSATSWQVSDDGGLCGPAEIVASRDQAHAAADQRVRVYTIRGHAVLPWSVP